MINPDQLYQLWKWESDERLRTAARRRAIREARLARVAEHSLERNGSTPRDKGWATLLGDRALQLRRLWTPSRANQHPVGELNPCQSES
jgi:hypothetical protein